MTDDQGFLVFLAVGVVVVALIVVIGVTTERRKKKARVASFTVSTQWIDDQPYLASSDVALNDKRQWQLFQQKYTAGTAVDSIAVDSIALTDGSGNGSGVRTLHVARVSQSLRAGWPTAKTGFTAYFEEYARAGLPTAFAASGDRGITEVRLDSEGLTAVDASGAPVFSSPWSSLFFSNGPDLILKNDSGTVHIKTGRGDRSAVLEELVIKYGTLKQLHF